MFVAFRLIGTASKTDSAAKTTWTDTNMKKMHDVLTNVKFDSLFMFIYDDENLKIWKSLKWRTRQNCDQWQVLSPVEVLILMTR